MPNRYGSVGSYRYGFQGQEKDDEVKGEGNSTNFKYRMHDPRVGRFFAPDPLEPKYPWYSPYQFAGNKVIQFNELEGLEEFIRLTNKDWMARFFKVRPGDNLHVISKVTGVAVNDIIRFNPGIQDNPDHIEAGQVLMLRNMSGLTVGDFVKDNKQSRWFKDFIVELATSNENGPSIQSQAVAVMDPIGVAVEESLGVEIPAEVDFIVGLYQMTRGRAPRKKTRFDPDLPVQEGSIKISAVDNISDLEINDYEGFVTFKGTSNGTQIEFYGTTGSSYNTKHLEIEVVIPGKDGTFSDHSNTNRIGTSALKKWFNQIDEWAKSRGYESTRVYGKRDPESSSALPGRDASVKN